MLRLAPPKGIIPVRAIPSTPPGPAGPPPNPNELEDQSTTGQPDLANLDPDQDSDQDSGSGKFDAQKVPQMNAGYQGPEQGPFECQHCHYWQDPDSCEVVAGKIDPHGCCNNFVKGTGDSESPEEDANEPGEETPDTGAAPTIGTPDLSATGVS